MALSLENKSDLIPRFRKIPLFESLTDQELQSISGYFYEANYDKETVIFYERDLPGDTGSKIYFVLKGCVKLVKYSSDGESTIVRLSSIGEFFGVTGALTDKPMATSARMDRPPDESISLRFSISEVSRVTSLPRGCRW